MTRRRLVGCGSAVVLCAVAGIAWSQDPAGRPARDPDIRYYSDREIQNACGICHASQPPGFKLPREDTLALLNEFHVWQHHDLHRRACEALTSPLGEQMSVRLYGDPKAAAKKPDCLVCHATDTAPGAPLTAAAPDRFRCELGINCQACHGPAAKWDAPHRQDKWRTLTGREKKADYGLADLRNARGRAEKCVSCHVGSTDESKFVTHEMYAAGHPPLPAFELATFSRDEPRHWLPAAAVPAIRDLGDPKAARERYGYRKGEVEAARLVAVGAVVALRESVKLLAFDPDPAKPADRLDFAHFNCAACHHDLRVPARRQENGFPGAPGRPVPQTWPVWAVKAVLRHAETVQGSKGKQVRDEFDANYRALRAAFDAVPFGDRDTVRKAAAALAPTFEAVLALLDETDFTEPNAAGLMRELAAVAAEALAPPAGPRDYLDADGATHLARAAAAIKGSPPPAPDGKPIPPTFEGGPAALKRLHEALGLTARAAYDNRELLQADGSFPNRAKRAADYEANPAAVRDVLAELAKSK